MALFGSSPKIYSSKGAYWVWVEWSATQSVAANQSTITVITYGGSNSYGYYTGSSNGSNAVVNGSAFTAGDSGDWQANTSKRELCRTTVVVDHNSDGSKSVVLSGRWWYGTLFDLTSSSTVTLDVIPRYAGITSFSTSDHTCLQFKINYAVDRQIDDAEYNLNNTGWHDIPGTGIITGLSPGTVYNVMIRVKASASQLWTYSAEIPSTTVALSGISSSADFNLESALSVTISRPNANLYHDLTLEAYYGGAWQAVAINTAQANRTTSGSLDPVTAAVNTLFANSATVKSLPVRIKMVVRWGSGGAIQGTVYKSGDASIVNADPSIASVSYLDTSTTVQAVIGNNQKILRNRSSLKVVAGAAASQKGAKLANYKVTIGGSNYSVNAAANVTAETGKEISVGAVDQSANQTVVLTVTDTRGNTVARSFTVQMLDYQEPQILQAAPQRLNSYEASTTMLVEGRRYAVKPVSADVNEVYVRYRLKENPSGVYGAWITLTRSNGSISGLWQAIAVDQYMADYPNTKSYTVELQISDNFTTWVSTILELSEGIAILRMMKDKMLSGVDLELLNNKGLILESPNGTRYILKVNDSGVITTAIA